MAQLYALEDTKKKQILILSIESSITESSVSAESSRSYEPASLDLLEGLPDDEEYFSNQLLTE